MKRFFLLLTVASLFLLGCELNNDPRVNVTLVGKGTITLDPSGGEYKEGTTVSITAIPETGYTFYSWDGDAVSTSNTIEIVTGSSNTDLTAYMPVFMNDDKSIIVEYANPMPANITSGFTFRVFLDLPEDILDTGDGYRVWIRPYDFSTTLDPDGNTPRYWYKSSGVLLPQSDAVRGGWLFNALPLDEAIYMTYGTVTEWRLTVNHWDADYYGVDDGANLFYYLHDFPFTVDVD